MRRDFGNLAQRREYLNVFCSYMPQLYVNPIPVALKLLD